MRNDRARRLLGLLVGTSLLIGVAGSGAAAQDPIKIGLAMANLDQFLQTVVDAAQAKADELGVELTTVSADDDVAAQLGQVETFITDEMDAIIIVPVDTDAAGPMTAAVAGRRHPARLRQSRPLRPAD